MNSKQTIESCKKRLRSVKPEGVDLSDSLTVRRELTCDKILQDLEEEQIILIRSPPFSGKTSLATLLYERVQTQRRFEHAFKLSLNLSEAALDAEIHSHNGLSFSLQELFAASEERLRELGRVILIVDEIHRCYADPAATFFWHTIQAIQQGAPKFANFFILMLGSYGGDNLGEKSTPVAIQNPRGLEVVRFTAAEYAELVQAFNARVASEEFALNECMSSALFNLTLGIPGLTVWALKKFEADYLESTAICRHTPTESDFMDFLLGRFIKDCEFTRAISLAWTKRSDAQEKLRKMVELEGISPFELGGALETDLAEEGIVARVFGELQFSAPLVRIIVINALFRDLPSSDIIRETSKVIERRMIS